MQHRDFINLSFFFKERKQIRKFLDAHRVKKLNDQIFSWKILGSGHQCIEVTLISSAGWMLLSSSDVRKSNKPSSGEMGDTAVKVSDNNKR
jgi:hypothetical protein